MYSKKPSVNFFFGLEFHLWEREEDKVTHNMYLAAFIMWLLKTNPER